MAKKNEEMFAKNTQMRAFLEKKKRDSSSEKSVIANHLAARLKQKKDKEAAQKARSDRVKTSVTS